MEQVIEFAGYSASEATKILTQATSDLVDFGKESLWAYYDSSESGSKDIEKDLNSNYEKEKISALKRLLVMMGRGQDCKAYFAAVIKNVAFNSFAVKKLVYIYLLKYAEFEPDLAILSINSFQKDLSDPNAMIRAVALRVLCSIKVPMIASVSLAAYKKGVSDMSPYVKKAVAFSLVKTYRLDPSLMQSLIEILISLLNDKSAIVIGPALHCLNELCPDRYDLIHKHFKKICRLIHESDEWSLLEILTVMDRYCRIHFPDPLLVREDGGELSLPDSDYLLFYESCIALLANRNTVIVLTAARIIFTQSKNDTTRTLAARSLIRCMTRPKQEQHMILSAIKSLVINDPLPWHNYISAFAVFPTEMEEIKQLKLDILALLSIESNMNWVIPELKYYSSCHDSFLALYSIKCWRLIVTKIPSVVQSTLESLISLLSHPNDAIVGEAIITIRLLLSTQSTDQDGTAPHHEKLLTYLVSMYDQITVSQARASILWLIGRNLTLPTFRHAPDLLRIALKSFSDPGQESAVKLQTLVLSVLLRLHVGMEKEVYNDAVTYFIKEANAVVLKLAKLDADFDVRDFGRFLEGCLDSVSIDADEEANEEKIKVYRRFFDLLFHFLPVSKISLPSESPFRIESLSHFVGTVQEGYEPLPSWSKAVLCAEERIAEESVSKQERSAHSASIRVQPIVKPVKTTLRAVNLDDFYGESASSSNDDLVDEGAKVDPNKLWALDSEDSSSIRTSDSSDEDDD